jgi:hypothetical protein
MQFTIDTEDTNEISSDECAAILAFWHSCSYTSICLDYITFFWLLRAVLFQLNGVQNSLQRVRFIVERRF